MDGGGGGGLRSISSSSGSRRRGTPTENSDNAAGRRSSTSIPKPRRAGRLFISRNLPPFVDSNQDITTRVIAHELKLEETPVSKVMSRNPLFVLCDTLAVEALQKMVQGKFRHLLVENGEVIALLDIAKCLYDAIARMERAAEKGKAIAAAVEGVEKHWGT